MTDHLSLTERMSAAFRILFNHFDPDTPPLNADELRTAEAHIAALTDRVQADETASLADRAEIASLHSYVQGVTAKAPAGAVGFTDQPAPFATAQVAAGLPLAITSEALADGTVGAAYEGSLGAEGGSGEYSWAVGGLPTGLTVTTGGSFDGIPGEAGIFTLTATVTDQLGATATRELALSIA